MAKKVAKSKTKQAKTTDWSKTVRTLIIMIGVVLILPAIVALIVWFAALTIMDFTHTTSMIERISETSAALRALI